MSLITTCTTPRVCVWRLISLMFIRCALTGDPVTYRIRYRPSTKQTYQYEDVVTNVTQHRIVGLAPSTPYLFGIMARNMYGDSSYVSESVRVVTMSTYKYNNNTVKTTKILLIKTA